MAHQHSRPMCAACEHGTAAGLWWSAHCHPDDKHHEIMWPSVCHFWWTECNNSSQSCSFLGYWDTIVYFVIFKILNLLVSNQSSLSNVCLWSWSFWKYFWNYFIVEIVFYCLLLSCPVWLWVGNQDCGLTLGMSYKFLGACCI